MIDETRSEVPFSTLAQGRLRGEINKMIQQEARELYEGKDYASTHEWANGFEANREQSHSNTARRRY